MSHEKRVAVILVNGEIDYMCGVADAPQHIRDLTAMGFYPRDIDVRYFKSWETAENFWSRHSGY